MARWAACAPRSRTRSRKRASTRSCSSSRSSRRRTAEVGGTIPPVIRFGPFQVDPRTWTLSREGAAVELSPRLVEILGYLAAKGGDIVTKEELLDRFWPGVNISENTLSRAVADIRKALGDDAGKPLYLQTAARRGYRFVGESAATPTANHHAAVPGAGLPESIEDPFKAWVKGRLALDSLDVSRLPGAVAAFERAAVELPS